MKTVIAAILLTLCAAQAHAFLNPANTTYWVPNESSPQNVPDTVPCMMQQHVTAGNVLYCGWMVQPRQIELWDAQRSMTVTYKNQLSGYCRRGNCHSNGELYGHYEQDVPFIVQIWYYIGLSTEGKPVGYKQGTGPAYGKPAVSYVDAGKSLMALYERTGMNDENIRGEFKFHYEGGMDQFLADSAGKSNRAPAQKVVVTEAWCNPRMDDECYINNKKVSVDDLSKYLPVVNEEEISSAGGYCEYPICYDRSDRPVGVRS